MTVADLTELLEGLDPKMEVRMAQQPSWPFEYSIKDLVIVEGVVYLAEGVQLGYLPGEVAQELNW